MGQSPETPPRPVPRGALRRAVLVCAGIVLAASVLGSWLYIHRLGQVQRATDLVASQARAHLEAWLDARLTGMRMLATRWPDQYASNLSGFVRDAGLMQERLPGLLALNWIDPGGVIRVVVPAADNLAALGNDLSAHPDPEVRAALQRAGSGGLPVRSPTVELLQGGRGFAYYWPVRDATGAAAGFVNGVFRIEDLVAASQLAEELAGSFDVMLSDQDGTVAWTSAPDAPRPWRLATERRVPTAGGPDLVLTMAPSARTLIRALSLRELLALIGICYLVALGIGWLVFQRDRKQAEVRLSERRFRELLDLLPHPVYVKDATGRYTFVNHALAAASGRPAEALLGAGESQLPVTDAQRVLLARADEAVLESGSAMSVREETYRIADGSERVLEVVRVPFLDPVTGAASVLAMGVDVTERKRSEVYGARIASALDQAGEAITVLDRRGRVVFANPAFVRMMGFEGRSVVGLSMDAFAIGSGDGELLGEIAETLGRGEVWRQRYSSDWGDGVARVRDATVAPVRDEDGRLNGFIGVLRDVTREQQLEDELRQAQKLEAVGQLAGGIAHDFNNLLTVILGYATQLRDGVSADSPSTTAVREIERAAERASDLTAQLLTFSRRRSRPAAVAPLNEVVRGLSPMLTRLIGENILVELDLADDVPAVSAATGELEQIVVNLCLNARDAMPDGGRLRLWTARRSSRTDVRAPRDLAAGEYAVVGVTDYGSGMTAEVQRRIFEPFFTTKEVGAGTGLGLATVYGIAEQRGGGVHVESVLGKGSTVSVWLPVATGLQAGKDATPPDAPASSGVPAATILVVEDEPGIRQLMRNALEHAGHRVISASDGVDALQRCANPQDVDLLITDVVMPRMSGPELHHHLLGRNPRLQVLFVSGYAPDHRDDGLKPEDTFLSKPFRARDLIAEVNRLLGREAARLAG